MGAVTGKSRNISTCVWLGQNENHAMSAINRDILCYMMSLSNDDPDVETLALKYAYLDNIIMNVQCLPS